jgi:hypothetical protein
VQQEAHEQERQVQDVEIQGVQRIAGRREVPREVADTERDDEPGENRRVFQPGARGHRFRILRSEF